jgi:ethanolamine ammonia-lyase small subunit
MTRDRDLVPPDPWAALRRHTPARIALGRAGAALPLSEVLRLELAHAQARDAVHRPLALEGLLRDLRAQGRSPEVAVSAARDRSTYLTRPDLGRELADGAALPPVTWSEGPRIAILIGDGLSTLGVERHAAPLLAALSEASPLRWRAAPVVVALQARVALGDAVGAELGAELVLVLVGERPGLSSCDSLGAYLTHAPRPGRCDAERNCISNIRPEGLGYGDAARRIDWLAAEALRRGCTGVALKDESDVRALPKPG